MSSRNEAYLHPSAKGAAHELIVTVDLLRRGYWVFRQVSRASPCDLVMMKGSQCWRVEVTTAAQQKSGRPYCQRRPDTNAFDLMAWVLPDHQIRYEAQAEELKDLFT